MTNHPAGKGRTIRDATPSPAVWPECSECGAAYVLRLAVLIVSEGGPGWIWARDCNHKNAAPRVVRA